MFKLTVFFRATQQAISLGDGLLQDLLKAPFYQGVSGDINSYQQQRVRRRKTLSSNLIYAAFHSVVAALSLLVFSHEWRRIVRNGLEWMAISLGA
ncbi:MAG: hypothetical protein AAF558_14170 [Verrucomicrobiota bacterium]